jgi:hypothetical protein
MSNFDFIEILLIPQLSSKKICNIEPPLGYFLTPIRKMKAFSAILILFFVAAALGLKINVESI